MEFVADLKTSQVIDRFRDRFPPHAHISLKYNSDELHEGMIRELVPDIDNMFLLEVTAPENLTDYVFHFAGESFVQQFPPGISVLAARQKFAEMMDRPIDSVHINSEGILPERFTLSVDGKSLRCVRLTCGPKLARNVFQESLIIREYAESGHCVNETCVDFRFPERIGIALILVTDDGTESPLQVPPIARVRWLKTLYLRSVSSGSILPEVISLFFWECELFDSDQLAVYQMPDNARITVKYQPAHVVKVTTLEGLEVEYQAWHFSPVGDLKLFTSENAKGIGPNDLMVSGNGANLGDSHLLYGISSFVVHRRIISVPFTIFHRDRSIGSRVLQLQRNSTLETARFALSREFHTLAGDICFLIDDEIVSDFSQPVLGVENPICVRFLDQIRVVFESRQVSMKLDFNATGSELRMFVRAGLKLQTPPDDLILSSNGCDLSDSMSLRDLNHLESLHVRIRPIPIIELTVILRTRVVPRQCKITVAANSTLQVIEPILRGKWSLEEIDIEFQLGSFETDDWRVLPKETVIGSIDLTNGDLTVTEAARAVSVSPIEAFQQPESAADKWEYHFVLPGFDEPVTISLPSGSTALAARTEVARLLKVEIENVTMLFGGKAVRDGFLLERMQLRGRPFTAYVRDTSEVLLLTAAAMRSSNG
jgi:hypothetical protein